MSTSSPQVTDGSVVQLVRGAPNLTRAPLLILAPERMMSSIRSMDLLTGAYSLLSQSLSLWLLVLDIGFGRTGPANSAKLDLVNNVSLLVPFTYFPNTNGCLASVEGEASYIKYPVLVISGIVAVAQALPLLLASLWRSTMNLLGKGRSRRFTTRDSFARGRGDYAIVDEDEGELLGDESDEEV